LEVCAPVVHESLTDVLSKRARFGNQLIELEKQDLQLVGREKSG
jgi:hypothetical protein